VAAINPGDEIVLTTKSSRTKRRLLTADSASVTVLNVGDPAIPDDVREALEDAGEDHPGYFAQAATAGSRFALTKHVQLGPDGVFQDDRRLFDVAHVTEVVPREDVIEVGVMGKHVARHARRGVLIGAAVGAVFMTVAAATCSDTEDCNAAGFALLGAGGGALVGVEIGTIVGAIAPRLPDVVYRR
jgi:hypothetical protein